MSRADAVAVVVVTHNSADHLPDLIGAVSQQLREDDEFVIVDNLSTDATVEIARMTAVDRGRLRVIETGTNDGFAAACHVGADATTAPLLLFLNPDCVPEPGCLQELRAAGATQPDWGAWQAAVLLPDASINTDGGVIHYIGIGWAGDCGLPATQLPEQPREVAFPSGAALTVRRPVWDELGGLDPSYFLYVEDPDLGLRMWLSGHPVGIVPAARVVHGYEFEKGTGKWFWLERNRWRTVLSVYPPGAAGAAGAGAARRRARDPPRSAARRLARCQAPRRPGRAARPARDAPAAAARAVVADRLDAGVRRPLDLVTGVRLPADPARPPGRARPVGLLGTDSAIPLASRAMTMLHAWVLYPIILIALCAGWGVLVEKAAGRRFSGMMLIPLGMVAVIVVSGFFTGFSGLAKTASPICAVGAIAGLAWGQPWKRVNKGAVWPALAALGVFLIYGAPVLLYGHPTWLGYLRLDDSGTWFDVIDNVMAHARNLSSLPPSTFALVFNGDVGPSYPLGAFQLLGVSHQIAFIDPAWVFDPYMAICGAAMALVVYELAGPFVESAWRKGIIGFLAAQPALLYGYYLWGGIKEVTGALVLVCGIAVIAPLMLGRQKPSADADSPGRFAAVIQVARVSGLLEGRQLIPVGLCAGALLTIVSVGAVAWLAPAALLLLIAWVWADRKQIGFEKVRGTLVTSVWVLVFIAAFAVPLWLVIHSFLNSDAGLYSAGQNTATQYGNLIQPLDGFQLFGIWTIGDFRLTAPTFPTYWLVYLVIAAAAGTIIWTIWKNRQFGPALYAVVALAGVGIFSHEGSTPWVLGKSLAIASPAVFAVALIGAGILWQKVSWKGLSPGILVVALLAFGVIWSNERGYHDALLAPYQRMSELAQIGKVAKGDGPMFINDYEIYADRHFDRSEAPVEPAEYRQALLPVTNNVLLVKSAYADIDSFALQTLMPYRSIVTRNAAVESRPPSIWKLKWSGTYYQLWVRPENPTEQIIEHIPLGDQSTYLYCGAAENGPTEPLCSIAPAAIPTCASVKALGTVASHDGADLMAYERPDPIVLRGDNVLALPPGWGDDGSRHVLIPHAPGTATAHIQVPTTGTYKLSIAGVFTRGFDVGVDGRPLGLVANEISDINGYVPVATIHLTAGVHTFTFRYPKAGIGPGAGDNQFTELDEVALQPTAPAPQMLTVPAAQAQTLCGKSLDWIELVKNA